jgi:hypothetical protein
MKKWYSGYPEYFTLLMFNEAEACFAVVTDNGSLHATIYIYNISLWVRTCGVILCMNRNKIQRLSLMSNCSVSVHVSRMESSHKTCLWFGVKQE